MPPRAGGILGGNDFGPKRPVGRYYRLARRANGKFFEVSAIQNTIFSPFSLLLFSSFSLSLSLSFFSLSLGGGGNRWGRLDSANGSHWQRAPAQIPKAGQAARQRQASSRCPRRYNNNLVAGGLHDIQHHIPLAAPSSKSASAGTKAPPAAAAAGAAAAAPPPPPKCTGSKPPAK